MSKVDISTSQIRTPLGLLRYKKILRIALFVLFFASVFFVVFWIFDLDLLDSKIALGFVYVLLPLVYLIWIADLFLLTYVLQPSTKNVVTQNFADRLDVDTASAILWFTKSEYKDISALLLPIASAPGLDFILLRIGENPKTFVEKLNSYLKTTNKTSEEKDIAQILEDAASEAENVRGEPIITWRDLLITLSVYSPFFHQFLFENKLDRSDIRTLAYWQWAYDLGQKSRSQFWKKENLLARRGIGKDWASGYTVTLDKYATDITEGITKGRMVNHLFGRVAETESIERVLARSGENNVVIVGQPGVGKKTIVYALAKKIAEGDTLPQLAHKRVLELDVGALLAGASAGGEVEARMKRVFNEAARAGNVILLVDEIHILFTRTSSAGTIDATQLLLPYLTTSGLQVVGLTSYDDYHAIIAVNSTLEQSFAKVEVHEPPVEDVFRILQLVVPQIEAHSHVLILYQAMKSAIILCDRYIKNEPFPEKAIDVLEDAAVYARAKRKSPKVTTEDIEAVIRQRTEIPVGNIALAEKNVLLDLEKILHDRIVGQDEAIKVVADALRRSRSGIASAKKPIGSFLFLGPTGVGKTETAKALSATYFGSEKLMLRFDMSEYQQARSIDRLIGGGTAKGQLTNMVIENPFSLLLLDELEKAHPDILNIFLQVLDDGRLTDAAGKTVDFTNTIIIATSNAGSELIRESVSQFREANLKERLLHHLQTQGIFRPEFLNRFDAVVVYRPLTEEQTEAVTELLLKELNKRLKEQDITVVITPELVKKVAQLGYDPAFGARPLRRVIQDKIESLVAKKLLSGEISRGNNVTLDPKDLV